MGKYNAAGVTYNEAGLTYNDFTLTVGDTGGGWLSPEQAKKAFAKIRKQRDSAEKANDRKSNEWKKLQQEISDNYDRLAGITPAEKEIIQEASKEVIQINKKLAQPKKKLKKSAVLKFQKKRLELLGKQMDIFKRYTKAKNVFKHNQNAIALLLFD